MDRCLYIALALVLTSCGQPDPEAPSAELLEGKLRERLITAPPYVLEPFEIMPLDELKDLPASVPQASVVYSKSVFVTPGHRVLVVLVEPIEEKPFLLADADLDGRLQESEQFEFAPLPPGTLSSGVLLKSNDWVRLDLPITNGAFAHFPLALRHVDLGHRSGDRPGIRRAFYRSQKAMVEGTIEIDGKPTRLCFASYHSGSGQVDLGNGRFGVDSDQDGEIDLSTLSWEWTLLRDDEDYVFRIGEEFFSVHEIDLANRTFHLRRHPPTDYRRIEVKEGALLPDFPFQDFQARSRRLSDFRGNYLLLDFWGSWCGPCVAQLPYLKEVYEEFHPQGVEFLGMTYDPSKADPTPQEAADGLESSRRVIEKHSIPWPQADPRSILELNVRGFRIPQWPTLILLDPEGKVISHGLPLRHEGLPQTLRRLLSDSQE